MRSERKRKLKIRRKRKRRWFALVFIVSLFFCSALIYGEGVFYAIKTFIYRNQALKIDIAREFNQDLDNINLNFINEGSCDVYLRGFVFVYPKDENNGTILSNSSVKINYGDKNLWYVGEDNYIYYTEVLEVGESTRKPMIESMEINLSDDDKRMIGDKKLAVDIVMEAVQMNNFAYKYQWDMNNTDLESLFNNMNEQNKVLQNDNTIELKFKE